MKIRRFSVSYGSYFGSNYEVELNPDGQILYYRDRPLRDMKPYVVRLTAQKLYAFFSVVLPITKRWRKSYNVPVCDGVCWEVDILVDDYTIRSGGLSGFPHDFSLFLDHFRALIGRKSFAYGHAPDPFFDFGRLPERGERAHEQNRAIRRQMRACGVTVAELACFLGEDGGRIAHQLRSVDPFHDFLYSGIMRFLTMSVAERRASMPFGSVFK